MNVDYDREKNTVTVVIDDVTDLLNVQVHPKHQARHDACEEGHKRSGDGAFFWGEDFRSRKGIEEACEDGWDKGLKQLREVIDDLDLKVKGIGRRRRKSFSDMGDDIDMQKVYGGQLDTAWDSFKMVQDSTRPKSVTIAVGILAHCGVNSKDFFWRGATALLIADALQTAGISVRIIGYCISERVWAGPKAPRIIRQQWTVKDHGEHLDMERLTFMLCSGGFARHYTFKVKESYVYTDGDVRSTYGYPRHEDWWGEVEGESVINIEDIWSEAACRQFIADLLRREDIGKVFVREETKSWNFA